MQPGAATIPCPNCRKAVPVGARFCGDCGQAITPAQSAMPAADRPVPPPSPPPAVEAPVPASAPRLPRPDDITLLPSGNGPVPLPRPDDVTVIPFNSQPTSLPRPDDVTVIPPTSQPPPLPRPDDITVIPFDSQPASLPRPDDITVIPLNNQPTRLPRPDDVTVIPLNSRPTPRPDDVTLVDSSSNRMAPPNPARPAPGQPPAPGQVAPGWPTPGNQPFPAVPPTLPPAVPAFGNQAPPQFPPPVAQFPRRRSFLSRPLGKIALFFLLVAVIGGGVGLYFIFKGVATQPQQSTLPSNVPLPTNATFFKQANQLWYYTVPNTTPQQVRDFYQTQLPQNGWQEPGSLASSGGFTSMACNQSQELDVVSDTSMLDGVAAPGGGVVLKISLKPATPAVCSSQ